jgi:hypothetical protein
MDRFKISNTESKGRDANTHTKSHSNTETLKQVERHRDSENDGNAKYEDNAQSDSSFQKLNSNHDSGKMKPTNSTIQSALINPQRLKLKHSIRNLT